MSKFLKRHNRRPLIQTRKRPEILFEITEGIKIAQIG